MSVSSWKDDHVLTLIEANLSRMRSSSKTHTHLQGPQTVLDRVGAELDAIEVVDDPFQLKKQDWMQPLHLVC